MKIISWLAVVAFSVGWIIPLRGMTFTSLYSFPTNNSPSALVQATDGHFYGTTYAGGSHSLGDVFRATTNGIVSVVFSFSGTNGANPASGLIQAADGYLYGTTTAGGASNAGTVFRFSTNAANRAFATVFSFSGTNGDQPVGPLIQASDGFLYGTTYYGGANDSGVVFRLSTNGVLTVLAGFPYTNGVCPAGGVIQGKDGNFYGTTEIGGILGGPVPMGGGSVFTVTPGGVLTAIHLFTGYEGANPVAGLAVGLNGNLYGTTSDQDSIYYLGGSVFQMTTAGGVVAYTNLMGTNGFDSVSGLTMRADGDFYGTTVAGGALNAGTVFRYNSTNGLVVIWSFNTTNGASPLAAPIVASDGRLYGTTDGGGLNGAGTLYRIEFRPELKLQRRPDGTSQFSWDSVIGESYWLEYSSRVTPNIWSPLTNITATATNLSVVFQPGVDPNEFYRVIVEQ